jgi:polyphosphate kinase
MARNLGYRVEAMVPVGDPALAAQLQEILDVQLADNCKAWELAADGTWTRRRPAPGEARRPSQRVLLERTLARARG